MSWSLGGTTIYVDKDSYWKRELVMARLQVIEATSETLHYGGCRSQTREIGFHVETQANMDSIQSMSCGSAPVELISDQGSEGNVYIMSLTPERKQALNKSDPWWYCQATLLKAN